MSKRSIAYRISIYISLSVIAVFLSFIFVYFLFNYNLIKENAKNKAMLHGRILGQEIEQDVIGMENIVSYISQEIISHGNEINIDNVVRGIMENFDFINSVYLHADTAVLGVKSREYFAVKKGDSISSCSNVFVNLPSKEQHVVNMFVKNKNEQWSEPYKCSLTNKNVVSYYCPLFFNVGRKDECLVGKIVCEMSLESIIAYVDNLNKEKVGSAHLLSKKGMFIVHSNEAWSMKRTIFDVPQKSYGIEKERLREMVDSVEYLKAGTIIARPEELNYKKTLIYYTPIGKNKWVLMLTYSLDNVYSPLYLHMLQLLFFSVLGILAVYMAVTYITSREIEPLSYVSRQLKQFAILNQSHSVINVPENEVRQIEESLYDMRSWYNRYLIDQSEEKKQQKKQRENMEQAAEIQQGFLKNTFPAFPGRSDIDLYSEYKPKDIIGGDLFDYFFIDKENLVLTMGDVSGKGLPAAFFMSIAQTIIKNYANSVDAKSIVKQTNEELYTNNHHQFFLTLFLGIFNVKTGTLKYCNAAHTASYILKKTGDLIDLADTHGLPLGLYANKEYEESTVRIEKGDALILYTDGVVDLLDERQKRYGRKNFKKNLVRLAKETPKVIVEKLIEDFDEYRGKVEQSDDISLLVFEYKK